MSVEELEVALCCTLDDNVVITRLSFTEPPKEVDDIKLHIQTAFCIPKCTQQLLYNGAVLAGTEQVDKLYMRSGDSIVVRYHSKLDADDFKVITTWLRQIRDIVLSYEKDDPAHVLSMLRSPDASESSLAHSDVSSLLGKWGTPKVEVIRKYIIQEGGIDLVLKLYGTLTKIHWHELNIGSLDDLNGCLRIMWNFCETYDVSLFIDQRGGFDLMVKSLSHPSVLHQNEYTTGVSSFAAMLVGCISA